MRVLIVDVCHEHPSTSHRNFYKSLSEFMDVTYFGPGYTDEKILRLGIKRYLKENDDYDFIFITWAFVLCCVDFAIPMELYHYHRYALPRYKINTAIRYCIEIYYDLLEQTGVRKILCYYHDMDNIKDRWYEKICQMLDNGFYLLSEISCQFIPEAGKTPKVYSGDYLVSDNARKIAEKYFKQIITIPVEAASFDEYEFRCISERKYDWIIPGSLSQFYPYRSKVMEIVKSNMLKVWDEAVNRTMAYKQNNDVNDESVYYNSVEEKILNTTCFKYSNEYIPNYLRAEALGQFHENYRDGLRKSKMAYADGGMMKTMVRKYFEIPAAGTVLVCDDIYGLNELGFVDMENCIIATPENLIEKTSAVLKDDILIQKIANAGRNLVIKKHSVIKRANDTLKVLLSIKNNRFRGVYWEHGNFIIEE